MSDAHDIGWILDPSLFSDEELAALQLEMSSEDGGLNLVELRILEDGIHTRDMKKISEILKIYQESKMRKATAFQKRRELEKEFYKDQ